jgi:hypothetical protein
MARNREIITDGNVKPLRENDENLRLARLEETRFWELVKLLPAPS